jgi:methylglutaconyl-CoA hydratase
MMKFIKVENYESNDSVKIVSLNRAEVKNAFHSEMIGELTEFFNSESSSIKTQFIVLKGEGTAFCSGADLNWMKSMLNYTFEENIEDSKKLWNMFEAIYSCQVPLITIAHGGVFGGGLGLLACADYVIAENKTQFCFSEVKLGLAPAVISGFISKKLQDAFYRPLMLSGEVFSADEARRIGLVHQTFSEKIEISDVVKKFSSNGREAMRETKKLLSALNTSPHSEHQAHCTKVISERRTSAEGQEKIKKFLSK